MTGTFCVKHGGKPAVGYCSKCNKPYCEDCLDMETGKPVCHDCMKAKAAGAPTPVSIPAAPKPVAAPTPMTGSPLNFKGKGLDDDPLGLFSGGVAPKVEAPKLNPPVTPPPMPSPTPKPVMPSTPPTSNLGLPSTPKPASSLPSLDQLGRPPLPMEKSATPTPKGPMDLDSLLKEPQGLKPSFPQASYPAPPPASSSSPMPFPTDVPVPQMSKQKRIFSLVKIWVKFLIRRAYELFDPLAKKLKIPTYVVIGLIAAIIVGAVIGLGAILNQPSVPLVDSIQPLHLIQVNSGQVSEMDITAYTDVQNQVQTMGFQSLLQMTVPQIPSPNFFDVGMKSDAGVYSEIIKFPGQLAPKLSFVTVFTNGVWFSTNGWDGTSHNSATQVSEFYSGDTPDQLYVQHMQTLEKLKQDNGWDVQSMSENRYMAAFSDRVRSFLDKKGVPAYQADFNLWH